MFANEFIETTQRHFSYCPTIKIIVDSSDPIRHTKCIAWLCVFRSGINMRFLQPFFCSPLSPEQTSRPQRDLGALS